MRCRLTGVLPVVLYLSYMGLLVWCLFLAMGTIGFLSSFLFTYAIFNAAKSVSGWGMWVEWRLPEPFGCQFPLSVLVPMLLAGAPCWQPPRC